MNCGGQSGKFTLPFVMATHSLTKSPAWGPRIWMPRGFSFHRGYFDFPDVFTLRQASVIILELFYPAEYFIPAAFALSHSFQCWPARDCIGAPWKKSIVDSSGRWKIALVITIPPSYPAGMVNWYSPVTSPAAKICFWFSSTGDLPLCPFC